MTKELFETVTLYNVTDSFISTKTIIFYKHKGLLMPSENTMLVNDFYFMCKEWALEQGYELSSKLNSSKQGQCDISLNGELLKQFYSDTEQESVFKACEYIKGLQDGI